MSVRTVSLIECDVHADRAPATTSRTFSVQGRDFEIDMCDEGASEFDETMEAWIVLARQVGGRKKVAPNYESGQAVAPSTGSTSTTTPRSANKSDAAAIRAWAKGRKGVDAGTKGRIPQKVRDAYYAAQGTSPQDA